jgi:hypothetical protein
MSEALTIPGVDAGVWQIRSRFSAAAATLADRHYSRERVGSPQVGGPGHTLIMVTPCERAAWVTKRHALTTTTARAIADGLPLGIYRCGLFRNEGAGLSSALVFEAMRITELIWGDSEYGWATYVDTTKVRSANPGYCFKQAGWWLDREWSHPHLVRLRV